MEYEGQVAELELILEESKAEVRVLRVDVKEKKTNIDILMGELKNVSESSIQLSRDNHFYNRQVQELAAKIEEERE